jgi:hypothetical protein
LSSLAMTDPRGKGDFHGDVDAVRAANMEDPHRKIYDGSPAVTPATAGLIGGDGSRASEPSQVGE